MVLVSNWLLSPQLRIKIDGISENNKDNFVYILEMDAKFKILNIPLPLNFDQGKLICEAKPEGKLNYWRITKIKLFKG